MYAGENISSFSSKPRWNSRRPLPLIFSHLFLAIDGASATPVNLLTCHIPPSKASAPRPAPKLVPRIPPTNGAPPLLSPSNTPAAENQFARAAYLRNHLAHSTILNPSDTYHLGSKCMLSGGPRLKCNYLHFIHLKVSLYSPACGLLSY